MAGSVSGEQLSVARSQLSVLNKLNLLGNFSLISSRFVKLWEPQYNNQKFPIDFYREHRDGSRNADHPEQLKEHLLALLHWKDGKASAYVPGEKHAKPNTLKPIYTLTNTHLANFAQSFRDLAQADENNMTRCIESLRDILSVMWKKNTVVIPAFILQVARPDRLPIIDQHTVRAWLALTEGRVDKNPRITWGRWRKYVAFFQEAVVDAGYDHNLEEQCKVDRALFAWGKSLKGSCGSKPDPRPAKPAKSPPPELCKVSNSPHFWGQQVPHTGVIPTNCNVITALRRYLDHNDFEALPPHMRQNLRDLQFHKFPQAHLQDLLQNPGGRVAMQLLQHYKEEMGGGGDIILLPRPILDVFLVGRAYRCGYHSPVQMAGHLHTSGFGGTRNAAQAAVNVGRTTGRMFGLLDDAGNPTAFFHDYFGI